MSEYDLEIVEKIIFSGEGDWYTAHLFRLIAKADMSNLSKLYQIYPDEVNAVHKYKTGKPFAGNDHEYEF